MITKFKHFGPGGVFAIPSLKPFNGTKNCFECGSSFSLFKQKYHCRNCGNVVCSNCSDQRYALQKFGYENPVRCCDTCDKFINMQQMNSNELSNLSPKALKEYITAYNLPFKAAIEKSDLVRIIFNTRPISNENEKYYRNCRSKQPSASPSTNSNSDNDNSNSFSFSNIMHDLFTPPSIPSPSNQSRQQEHQRNQQDQQRRQQEQRRRQLEQQRQQQEQNRVSQQLHEEHMRRHQEQVRAHHQQQQQQQQEHLRQQQQQQQAAQSSQRDSPTRLQRTSPPLSNNNLLSLHDLVKAKIDPASLSVRTLKSILKANFVEQSHVIEKSELVKLVVRLADQHKADMESEKKNEEGGGGNEDNLCRICFDNQQNCVFLDCGHMVTCMECAKKLIESKNECPICREPILKLVHVFRS